MRLLKRLSYMVLCFMVASLLFGSPLRAHADSSNLITNGNFEQSSGTPAQPVGWTSDSWGQNSSSFNYLSTGYNSTNSAQTVVSGYSSGDAKWIFTPVNITGGDSYQYSDWYESNVITNLWAQYSLSDGTTQYTWLGATPVASTWSEANKTFNAPSDATSVSIFHVINTNGQLTIDDAYLSTPCSVSEANGIYNGGFEQTCPNSFNTPADWQPEAYGSPGAAFNYVTSPVHSGNYAVKATMSGSSGETGWQTYWQAAAANQHYGLTFWQTGTAYVYAYVEVQLTDGSDQYLSLMSVPSTQNTGWSQYSDAFITPANTASMQVTIATSEPGYFYLDDVYLNTLTNEVPPNFNQGVVSLTFDDGDASAYQNGLPVLEQDGLIGTFYLNGSTLGTKGYMTNANVKAIAAASDEIASHEYQHIDLVTETIPEIENELNENNTALKNILGSSYPITDFASPYGSYTSTILQTVMSIYNSHRTTDGQFNSKANFNPTTIHAILVTSSTSVKQVETWITQAQQDNEWLVLVYHSIGSSPPGGEGNGYATTPAHFQKEMAYLKTTGLSVDPINQALPILEAQINQ